MIRTFTLTALCAFATSPAIAGGWETGKLDTSFLMKMAIMSSYLMAASITPLMALPKRV